MKVEIIKAINVAGKSWSVGATPSVTSELYRRLLKSGHCKPIEGDAVAADEPTPEPTPEPETKAEEVVTEPRPRPTRKPRKPMK